VTVLVDGGEIAWADVAESLHARRLVLTVAGTGRTADALAEATAGRSSDARAARLVATGLVEAIGPGTRVATAVERRIVHILTHSESADAH